MKNKKLIGGGILCIVFVTLLLTGCVTPKHAMVPMRDTVQLATDVYVKQPSQQHGSILIRTPYDKNALVLLGMNWAQNSWPTIIQDMRGRFASEGIDTVFKNEHTD